MHLRSLVTLVAALVAIPLALHADDRKKLVTQLGSCEAIFQEFQADPATAIPAEVLRGAKALVIVNEFQAGFLIGGKGGYGVAMVRRTNGGWSVPTFLDAGEASIGFQLGAKSVNTIYVINDEVGARLLYRARFNFGADAAAVAGPRTADVQEATQIIKAPVYVYQKNSGLFAGAKVKTGWLAADNNANRLYYQTERTMPELLWADWVTPPQEAEDLRTDIRNAAGN
ncbi:MAG TPA: lipid-binding SYLF domain-containing protein [Opitutaceae bacterium]|nr:lipid-binding SYLF domain-containing protein [Opitutaceae bacterium]